MIASIRPRSMALDSRVASRAEPAEIISLNILPRCEAKTNLPRRSGTETGRTDGETYSRAFWKASIRKHRRFSGNSEFDFWKNGQVRFHRNENLSYRDLEEQTEKHDPILVRSRRPIDSPLIRWPFDPALPPLSIRRSVDVDRMKIKWRE